MAQLRGMPHVSVPVVDPNSGLMTTEWRLYFASRERAGLSNLTDVSTDTPANGEVLIWNDTTKRWEPGAN